MKLEKLVGEAAVEEMKGKQFGIDPRSSYKRGEFTKREKDLLKIGEYSRRLGENGADIDAQTEVIGLAPAYMTGEPAESRAQLQESPRLAYEQARTLHEDGSYAMARFVEHNRPAFFRKLSAKELYSVFQRTPSCETGDEEHDRVRALKEKILQMQEAAKNGGDIGAVVQEEVRELIEKAPRAQQIYISRNPSAMSTLTNTVIKSIQKAFVSLFRDEKGELDREALVKYLTRNYEVAENAIKRIPESEKGEREDCWNDNLKPLYLELARALFESEEKAQKMEDNPEKVGREEGRRALGLAA